MKENIRKFFCSEDGQNQLIKMALHPEKYLQNNCFPFFENRKGKSWIDSEVNFLKTLSNRATDGTFLRSIALCFPGRSSSQVYAKYSELLKKGIIKNDLRKVMPSKRKLPPLHRYFVDIHEELFASELLVMFNEGRYISKEIIREKARSFYMLPWVMSERATFQRFYMTGEQIYKDEDNCNYTDEFIEASLQLLEEIQPKGAKEPNIEIQLKIIEDYQLPESKFSDAWINVFMKRNHFSWRLAHYSRRGLIVQKHIDNYLRQLAEAIIKYGWERVYNLDETSVKINNGNLRTIAPVGTEKVIFEGVRNDKKCFTALATCSRFKKEPLIILGKGKIDACLSKFRKMNKAEVWKSAKGWVDEDVMLKYLDWFALNVSSYNPCALVMDCYRAHRTDLVKEKAADLNIDLIFVPASGTSLFQPLDRRIFGIQKISYEYSQVHEYLLVQLVMKLLQLI